MDRPLYCILHTNDVSRDEVTFIDELQRERSRIGLYRQIPDRLEKGTFGEILEYMCLTDDEITQKPYSQSEQELAQAILDIRDSSDVTRIFLVKQGELDTENSYGLEERIHHHFSQALQSKRNPTNNQRYYVMEMVPHPTTHGGYTS